MERKASQKVKAGLFSPLNWETFYHTHFYLSFLEKYNREWESPAGLSQ